MTLQMFSQNCPRQPIPASPKKVTNASSAENPLSKAKILGIDVSRVAEAELASAVACQRIELWPKENGEAIEIYNTYVKQHGLPLETCRMF